MHILRSITRQNEKKKRYYDDLSLSLTWYYIQDVNYVLEHDESDNLHA